MSPQEAYGQSRFDDKKLKTSKKPKRDNRKSFFRMENRENAPPTKVEVRTTQRKTKRKDKRTLIGPVGKDQTQNYDFKLRDVEQPYRPEISYEGFRKAKRNNRAPKIERDNRKSFFRMENRENAPPTKVEVRTTQRKTKRKDKRTLIGPVGKDQTQNYDFKLRDVEQPYRPEISYEGFRKAKRNNRAP